MNLDNSKGYPTKNLCPDLEAAFIKQGKGSLSGTDPGFFLGGGAPPRNGVTDW